MRLLIKQCSDVRGDRAPVFDGLFAVGVIKLCQYRPMIRPVDADDAGSEAAHRWEMCAEQPTTGI